MSAPGRASSAATTGQPTIILPAIPTPLPLPGTTRAPKFKGKHVREFLENLALLGRAAGLVEADLPPLIKRYSSSEVKRTITAETVFSGTDWQRARDKLIFLYESGSESYKTSAAKLRSFSDRSAKASRFRSQKQFDKYLQRFKTTEGRLVADGIVTSIERDYLFYKGLPDAIRDKVRPTIVRKLERRHVTLKKNSPPTMEETIEVTRGLFDPDDIDYDEGRDNTTDDDDDSSDDSEDSTEEDLDDSDDDRRRRRREKKRRTRSRGRSVKRGHGRRDKDASSGSRNDRKRGKGPSWDERRREEPTKANDHSKAIDELADTVRRLQLAVQSSSGLASTSQAYMRETGQSTPPQFGQQTRTCYMCGKVEGRDLDHRIGMRYCPDTLDLISRGTIKYCPASGNIVRANGTEIPRSLGAGTGGIAAILRAEGAAGSGQPWARDAPPHAGQQTRSCNAMGLFRDDQRVLGGDVSAVSSESATSSVGEINSSGGFSRGRINSS